jgi:hypothetical protein
MADIRTVKIAFKDLEFLQDNPRKISRQDLERLAGEIKRDPEFFNSRPCLVNYQDGRYLVYAGFQRAHAANTVLKWKEIPCSVENDLPTEVMRRRAILDNTHAGKWDADTLANWEFEPEELADMWVNPAVWGGDGGGGGLVDVILPEIPPEDELIADAKNKPPTMKITFPTPEDLQKAESEIQEVINRLCPKAFYSVSAGEI